VNKKAIIVIDLVEESAEESNEQIEKEIRKELSKQPPTIPWLKMVEKVTVTEE
jgi:Ribonuclease G/E